MSTEEQDAIYGRLMRQHGECQRNLAALNARVCEAGRSLLDIGKALCPSQSFLGPDAMGEKGDIAKAKAALKNLPDASAISCDLDALQAECLRMVQIRRDLKAFHKPWFALFCSELHVT